MTKKLKSTEVWVVIPSFNEAKYLPEVLKKLEEVHKNFILVDDGSEDNTVNIAKKFTSHVISHEINLGKGAALKTGCEYAFGQLKAQAVICMDGDDQHDPSEIPQFIEQLNQKSVVFGERRIGSEMPLIRIMLNRTASVLVLLFFGAYIPDIPSGFKAFRKTAYQKITWKASGYDVETEIAARVAKQKLPFAVVKIKTIYHDLNRGMSVLDTIKILYNLVNWRFNLGS